MKDKSNRPSTAVINALNKKCYDAQADQWNRFPFADFLPIAIQRSFPEPRGKKALDIGSGTGKFAAWLKNQGFDVHCLDPSDEMLKRCQKLGLTVSQATLQEFTTTETYDLVTAILSLIHVPKNEIQEQLTKIVSWQKGGGIFVVAFIEGTGEKVAETHSPFPRFFAYYSKEELLALLQSNYILIDEYRIGGTIQYTVLVLKRLAVK